MRQLAANLNGYLRFSALVVTITFTTGPHHTLSTLSSFFLSLNATEKEGFDVTHEATCHKCKCPSQILSISYDSYFYHSVLEVLLSPHFVRANTPQKRKS